MKNALRFYKEQLLLLLAALPLGAAAGAVCALFGRILLAVTDYRSENYLFLLPFLGLVGIGILWCYRRFGGDSLRGMALLYEVDAGQRDRIPLRLVPMVMLGTWLTHLFGGSAGREGVAVQIGGTVGHFLGRRLPFPEAGRLLMIAGMAAGFGGLFRTPLAAALFACEVLCCGRFEWRALLPACAASFLASTVSGLLGLGKFEVALSADHVLSLGLFGRLLLLGLLFGVTGWFFAAALQWVKKRLEKAVPSPLKRILFVGTVVGLASVICLHGRYSGLGTNLIAGSFSGQILPWDFAAKLLFTVITLGCGFLGGEVTPLFSIGASLGFVLAGVFGLPVKLCAALGYAAVFGSASKTVLAPMVIGAEVFGYEYLPLFFVVCTAAFIFSGRGSIYSLQPDRFHTLQK